eukprot:Clim_evm11s57 gene=Clim_evmTU11s57
MPPNADHLDSYQTMGYASPIHVLSQENALEYRHKLEDLEIQIGEEDSSSKTCRKLLRGDYRFKVHLLADWAYELVTHPQLLTAVRKALQTEDIMVWSSDFNIKEANSQGFFSWHQDSTYAGMSDDNKVVTAWLALSPSNRSSGCVRVLPRTHLSQLPHNETFGQNNMLSRGQAIKDADLDLESAVSLELLPGQASLHHFRCVHASDGNMSNDRRIGLAIRYMACDVAKERVKEKESAMLCPGSTDRYNNFIREDPPDGYLTAENRIRHREAMDRENANYFDKSDIKEYKV